MIEFCCLRGNRPDNQDALAVVTVKDGSMDVKMIHHDEEDFYTDSSVLPDGTELLLVADGMGGLRQGDQASFLTLTFFLERLQENFSERIDMTPQIAQAIQLSSEDLRRNCPDSGSTIVGVLTVGRVTWMFNVGDSKCIMDTGIGRMRSQDDSFDQENPTNIITSFIGMEGEVPSHISVHGDCGNAILFSDGLNPVFGERGLDIVDSNESAEFLCRQAIQKGGDDNTTCIIRRSI